MSAQQFALSAIDHLGVVGRDIAAMTAAYKRLGFTPTDPVPLMGELDGKPVPLGQDSAHLIFADSYVELSGVTSEDPGHHLAPWLAKRHGLHILALGSEDAAANHAALAATGLTVPDVQNAGRYVDYGSNHGDAQFRWFKIPDDLGAEGFLCMVEQVTPEIVFQPPADGHPNGALGVTGVTVLTEDVDGALKRYAALPNARRDTNGVVHFGSQTIEILDPSTLAERFPGAETVTPPALAGFTVRVDRLDETRACLEENGVTLQSTGAGDLFIGPDDGCGSMVIFTDS